MGWFSSFTKIFTRPAIAVATGGLSEVARGVKAGVKGDLAGAAAGASLGAAAATTAGTQTVGSALGPKGAQVPGVSGALDQAAIDEAAAAADRAERVRRARLALRGGTIRTSTLGSPLSGVALTRPQLGG